MNIPGPGAPFEALGGTSDVRVDVVEEDLVERLLAPLAHGAVALEKVGDGLRMTRVLPPITGGLAGRWNHRSEQDEQRRTYLLGHERASERAERLCDDDDVAAGRRCARHRRGVVAGMGFGIIKRQRRSERLVTTPSQAFNRGAVDLWIRTGARDEDKRGHERWMKAPVKAHLEPVALYRVSA